MKSETIELAIGPSGLPHAAGVFAGGVGEGLLQLATADLSSSVLPPGLGFARDLARAYCTALCQTTEAAIPPVEAELAGLAAAAPPLEGSEYLNGAALVQWWQALGTALGERAQAGGLGPQAWLHDAQPAWRGIGRVTFHLAENKRDAARPFAFLVTYSARVSARGEPQHQPLSRALTEFAGQRNRAGLLRLLEPIERAAESCVWVRKLLDDGGIYQALTWTPAEAHALLRDWPRLQEAGLMVRAPDWWNPARPPRPTVQVTVGPRAGGTLNAAALLEFTATVGLDGEPLSAEGLAALEEQGSGLVRLKGRWVDLDAARLEEALAHWQRLRKAGVKGLDLFAGMRLLAGVRLSESEALPAAEGGAAAIWSSVTASPELERWMSELRTPSAAAAPSDLRGTLRPYQLEGVQWLRLLGGLGLGACLADDMGLGKTLQVIALLLHRQREGQHGPALLVAPASLLANWRQELERFAPTLRFAVAHPSDESFAGAEAADADLVMTTYGFAARLEWLRKRTWGLVVLDEAQAIKNPGAAQTRAVKQLRATSRIALTGTPIENRLSDLWSLFDFLNPGLLGSGEAFGKLVKRLQGEGGSYAPLRRLIHPYLLRRLKTDKKVIADLPEKVEVDAFCALSRRQAAAYRQAVDELARALDDAEGIRRQGVVLATLTRLKQICNHPAQASGLGGYDERESGKFQRLREICAELAERQEKVLVFTQFREITTPLAEFLAGIFGRPGVVLDGSVPVRQRRERIEAFQREDGPPFFVLSLKAGGVGLNLTAAAHVVHFDRWWNPAVENQATDRAFRIGQKRSVMVHKFVCRGTVEDKIADLMRRKSELADGLMGGAAEIPLTELANEEILRLVRLDATQALE